MVLATKWEWGANNLKIGLKLALVLIIVVVMATTTATIFSAAAISTAFTRYIQQNLSIRLEQLAANVADHYQSYGWQGVDKLFVANSWRGRGQSGFGQRKLMSERFIIADKQGIVVFDSYGQEVGKDVGEQVSRGVPIIVDGGRVGTIIASQIMGNLEQDFIQSVRKANWYAGIIAVVMAMIVSMLVSKKFSTPLVLLAEATRRIADKNLSYRVNITSKDEFGQVAQAFNKMAESLEKNESLRKQLIADVAHELRTPLTLLRGNLESLQEGIIKPSPEVFVSLHDESLRMSRLVADLQNLSLADAGELIVLKNPENLTDIITGVVNGISHDAVVSGVSLQLSLPKERVMLAVDRHRIEQIFYNLLRNALRYTPQGGTIGIALNQAADHVKIEITDTGQGIDAADLPYIFDRFYRVDKSRNRESGGAGLGLAITKSFVEAHGGEIWAESQLDHGSKFIFTLPK